MGIGIGIGHRQGISMAIYKVPWHWQTAEIGTSNIYWLYPYNKSTIYIYIYMK